MKGKAKGASNPIRQPGGTAMNTKKNRNLAKGFIPVLLLSAALSLPAVSVAAP
jgi:hypothetical protein